jgi:hypothetical protein
MFDRFTDRARSTMDAAHREASRLQHDVAALRDDDLVDGSYGDAVGGGRA